MDLGMKKEMWHLTIAYCVIVSNNLFMKKIQNEI